jgi:hypothetical protein
MAGDQGTDRSAFRDRGEAQEDLLGQPRPFSQSRVNVFFKRKAEPAPRFGRDGKVVEPN